MSRPVRHAVAEGYASRRRSRNRTYSMRTLLGAIVVIATSLALMASAISITQDVASQDSGFYRAETSGAALTDEVASGASVSASSDSSKSNGSKSASSDSGKSNGSKAATAAKSGKVSQSKSTVAVMAENDADADSARSAGGSDSADGEDGASADSKDSSSSGSKDKASADDEKSAKSAAADDASDAARSDAARSDAARSDGTHSDNAQDDAQADDADHSGASAEGEPSDAADGEPASSDAAASDDPDGKGDKATADMPAQTFEESLKDKDGNVILTVAVNAPAGAFPNNTSMKIAKVANKKVRDQVEAAIKADDSVNGEIKRMTAVDIVFVDEKGAEIEPAKKVEVKITSDEIRAIESPVLVHVVDKDKEQAKSQQGETPKESEVVKKVEVVNQDETRAMPGDEDTLKFASDTFSPYVIVELEEITTQVITADGKAYTVTVTYGPDAGIPDGSELAVAEIEEGGDAQGVAFEDYLARAADALGWDAASLSYARLFDIKIVHDGNKVEISAPVSVSIRLADKGESAEAAANTQVVHFADGAEKGDVIQDVDIEGDAVSFEAEGFSAYAIVEGPSNVPRGWTRLSSMTELQTYLTDGIYIGHTDGYYLSDEEGVATNNAHGIVKTKPAEVFPSSSAAKYYFEAVEGTTDQYILYCIKDGVRYYIQNTSNEHLYLTTNATDATPFKVVAESNGRFSLQSTVTDRYLNNWQDANGVVFACWTAKNAGSYFYLWHHDDSVTGDPYGLDGKTYGLMNWEGSATGRAMMSDSSNAGKLDALALTVMAKTNNNNDRLFVPDDSGISFWTFHYVEADRYYLTTEVGGTTKYLKVTRDGISLVDTPDDSCKLQVVPGTGARAGQVSLNAGNIALTYSGKVETGFGVGGAVGTEWLNLVEESELTSEYFMTYSAQKVSVSDPNVTNGSRIIVYARVWNDTKKKYEFYAVDHDGSLVRCYETGDSIEWVGPHLNTMQWNFVEYYWEGTNDPNFYYDLYNQYSDKYIAPQVSDGQILSDDVIGLNLDGRKNGHYYSTVLAWDDDNYSYVGLKADLNTGKVVSCPKAEADDFYFAIMQPNPVDDELITVPTVDHVQHGITMKMVNFGTRAEMSNYLGNDQYTHGNTTANLLSTNLGEDGYPTAAGGSLASWFGNAQEVNHLFIESTYSGTGYYEYDSTQNFAHLNTSGENAHNFTVYKEIGTTDNSGESKFYTHGQFFPYNDLQAGVFSSVYKQNTTSATGSSLDNSDPRKYEQLYLVNKPDYYMGVEIEASFTQTPDGKDDWGHDIIYEFTGDDDFWLYVDGELVIDLGGIHDALPGTVNFRTGDVTVNGRNTSLYELFHDNYRGRGMTEEQAQAKLAEIFVESSEFPDKYIFKDYTTHTMNIFYLERGAGASNLHMRFNLASVKPGTVQLTKKLSGVESQESVLAEFPYQIYYKTEGSDVERRLTNSAPAPSTQTEDYVFYKDSTIPVTYKQQLEIAGVTYPDVFMLYPDETVEINFPDDVTEYRIVECGVDTTVYREVRGNGEVLTGTDVHDGNNNVVDDRKDFGIGYATPDDRARVTYENDVDPEALRTMTFEKKLFEEDGKTPIVYPKDMTVFNFRLYLATEFDGEIQNSPASMHTYHVKDPAGKYCKWVAGTGFVATDYSDYGAIPADEKSQIMFTTSLNGSISRIPIGYTVEVRDVLAGTRFMLVERPNEMPDGYSFQKYVYQPSSNNPVEPIIYTKDETHSYADVAWAGVTDIVEVGKDPHIDVCNLKGWGLRVNKVWSDAAYMTNRDPVYFAVFTDDGTGNLTLVDGTVHQMPYGTTTSYWYFLPLPVVVPFDQYEIREVTVTDTDGNMTVNGEGVVTGYDSVTPIKGGDPITVSGVQKGETSSADYTYTVNYEKGSVPDGSNVRVDKTTNSRPGIELRKTTWDGETPLAGAVFTLAESESDGGNVIGTFTSDSEGLITVAFLGKNKDYILTETKAPRTPDKYHGLETSLTIRVDDEGQVTVSGASESYYTLVQEAGSTPTLTIKNRPFTLQALKKNAQTGAAVQGVKFALHKQHTVDQTTDFDADPMPGYESLVTNEDGVIPEIDETLEPGTYQLREIQALDGYEMLPSHTVFTISETGMITLGAHPDGVVLVDDTSQSSASGGEPAQGDAVTYVMTVPNSQLKPVSVWKTDTGYNAITTGATFELYAASDFNVDTGTPISGKTPIKTGTTGGNGLLQLGSLSTGTYYLVETVAPAGYNAATSPITVKVTATAVTAQQAGNAAEVFQKGDEHWISGQDDDTWQVRVWNSAGYELPHTGGPGTWPFIAIGALAVLVGAAMLRRSILAR